MSARKARPAKGDQWHPDMSIRDTAAALGVSKSELQRWKDLGAMPAEEFDRRLKEQIPNSAKHRITAASILRGAPVPSRGRVERAKSLFTAMNATERESFLAWLKVQR